MVSTWAGKDDCEWRKMWMRWVNFKSWHLKLPFPLPTRRRDTSPKWAQKSIVIWGTLENQLISILGKFSPPQQGWQTLYGDCRTKIGVMGVLRKLSSPITVETSTREHCSWFWCIYQDHVISKVMVGEQLRSCNHTLDSAQINLTWRCRTRHPATTSKICLFPESTNHM